MSNLFTRLSLAMLIATSLTSFASAQEMTGPSGAEVFVKVTQNREISGTPIDLTELKVTTSFGAVDIPMAKIDGIKMHADGNDSSVIAFKNGDLVTGTVELETVKLKTDWGTAHINTSQIEQITSDQSARFFSDASGTGAKAWRFQRTAPAPTRRPISPSSGFGIGGPGR